MSERHPSQEDVMSRLLLLEALLILLVALIVPQATGTVQPAKPRDASQGAPPAIEAPGANGNRVAPQGEGWITQDERCVPLLIRYLQSDEDIVLHGAIATLEALGPQARRAGPALVRVLRTRQAAALRSVNPGP